MRLPCFLGRFYQVALPVATGLADAGTYIVLGTPQNNPALAKLVSEGVSLTTKDIGDEGFQLLTHQHAKSRYIIIYGKTPRALKHGCQELIFYRMPATSSAGAVDWPLDVVMKPEFEYRGSYLIPGWQYLDTIASWERVLRFNSELTVNRIWFLLDG